MPRVKSKTPLPAKKPLTSHTSPKPSKQGKKERPRNDTALKKKFELLQSLKDQGIERDARKCIRRMGVNEDGSVRYCDRWAIAGGTVCPKHGGNAPQVKKAAQSRMLELLERKVERLNEISEQDGHLPSALGATQALINRVLGKVGEAAKKENTGTVIQLGIALSGGEPKTISVGGRALPEGSEEVIEADISSDDSDDE